METNKFFTCRWALWAGGDHLAEGQTKFVMGVSLNVILLGLVSFITDVRSEMIHPVLPKFVETLWASALAVGLVGGIGDLAQNILKAPAGYISDRIGRRKALTAAGYAISAVSKMAMPFSASWPQIMAIRAIERTGKGVRTAPRDALIAESGGKRGKAFGLHRALDTSGAVIGSVVALLLLLYGWSIRDIMILGALVAFLALVPLVPVKEVLRPKDTGIRRREEKHRSGLPRDLKAFVFVASLFGLANMTYMLFVLYALRFVSPPLGLDRLTFAVLLYVVFNVVYAFLSLPGGILSDLIGRKKVIAFGYVVFALTCMGFTTKSVASLAPAAMALFCLYGASKALIDGTQRAYASDLAPAGGRGYALGIFHTSIGFASLASGAIAGLIWDLVGVTWAFLYAAVLSAVSAVLLMALCK